MTEPQAPWPDGEVLAGIVERVTFHNAESGFAVLRVKARGYRDLVTIVGHAAALRLAFTRSERRTLRKSDGTAVIEGRRFEVPNQYRHISLPEVRFAAWDLTQVHLVDPQTGTVLCRLFPQDKAANASGLRRGLQPIATEPGTPSPPPATPPSPMPPSPTPARGIGPLLERMLERQAATGLPPAYLPKDEGDDA